MQLMKQQWCAYVSNCVCRDGKTQFKVFDPCAVKLSVEEGVGHRRSLKLQLASRDELPATEKLD